MNKVAQYLSEQLDGEVISSPEVLGYFSTDASIFKMMPQLVVMVRSESDIRKLAKFSWQLAEKGKVVPLTARGLGTDYSGAAIGSGIIVNFSANYNNLLILDPNKGLGTIQPGANYGFLQQMLMTHGYYMPVAPDSAAYSTIGGAVANNASGRRSQKYGSTKNYINSLRVVLADGEVIETGLLNQKQLAKKKSLPTFEGEIYRQLDELLISNYELINKTRPDLNLNNSGFDIWGIKDEAGNFDLTRLFCGSQGTLGLISEISFASEVFSLENGLLVAHFDDYQKASQAIEEISKLEPSSLEIMDEDILSTIKQYKSRLVDRLVGSDLPKILMLVEFDDAKGIKRKIKRAENILNGLSLKCSVVDDQFIKDDYWQLRDSVSYYLLGLDDNKKPLPIIGDAVIPPAKLSEFIRNYELMCDHYGIRKAFWGHGAISCLQSMPQLDLSQIDDRKKMFQIINAYYQLVTQLGGSISGQFNDGRLRAPYVPLMYGDKLTDLFIQIKNLFDPYNYLNPGVKLGTQLNDLPSILRSDYSTDKFIDYLAKN